MRKINILIVITILFSVASCNNPIIKTRYNSQLQAIDTLISLEIPKNMPSTSRVMRYFQSNGDEYLAISNAQLQSISIYNIAARKLVKNIKPEIEGPNGVGDMLGFDIFNFDTIFIASNRGFNSLSIIDSSATLINKLVFNLGPHNAFLRSSLLFSQIGECIFRQDNDIFVGINMCDENAIENMANLNLGSIYNFRSNESFTHSLKFPDITKLNDKIQISHTIPVFNDKTTIISFLKGHQVFVSNNNEPFQVFDCRSNYITSEFKNIEPKDMMESVRHNIENPTYLCFLHDKYRNVYYRFAYPGVQVENGMDLMKMSEFKKVFSVMVLDENFKVIAETLMPENTYNSNMFYINSAGLWISTNHVDNHSFNPDKISFQLFKIVENE